MAEPPSGRALGSAWGPIQSRAFCAAPAGQEDVASSGIREGVFTAQLGNPVARGNIPGHKTSI